MGRFGQEATPITMALFLVNVLSLFPAICFMHHKCQTDGSSAPHLADNSFAGLCSFFSFFLWQQPQPVHCPPLYCVYFSGSTMQSHLFMGQCRWLMNQIMVLRNVRIEISRWKWSVFCNWAQTVMWLCTFGVGVSLTVSNAVTYLYLTSFYTVQNKPNELFTHYIQTKQKNYSQGNCLSLSL